MGSDPLSEFLHRRRQAHLKRASCPGPKAVERWFDGLMGMLFPVLAEMEPDLASEGAFGAFVGRLRTELAGLVAASDPPAAGSASEQADRFFALLPRIHGELELDAEATFRGDPAAADPDEVIRCYPGFCAIAAYRTAHALHGMGIPILPRMLTEQAHARTGIDIHPAARIGLHLCIDHGTGIVIGETAEVGDHVKLYQGVTLGGLSVRKEDARTKRHPTVGDRVVLYAGATVLGGDTVIGHDSVIGGNVWLTKSVPPHSRVVYRTRMQHGDQGDEPDLIVICQEAV